MSVANPSERTAPSVPGVAPAVAPASPPHWIRDAGAVGTIALAFWLIFRHGYLGYDATYALVWGRELFEGTLPDYDLPGAPTPHPLANGVSGLLSLLGDSAAYDAMVAISYIAFGVVVWMTFRLGQQVFSTGVGAVAAVVVATSFVFLSRAQASFLDIPFVALVLTAVTLEARRPRRGLPVMALLAVAGLLRPEAWGLGAAYWLYLWPHIETRARLGLAALGAAPAVLWALGDLVITGDAMFSFTGAREAAQDLGVAEVADRQLVRDAADNLRDILRAPVLAAGAAGVGAALFAARRRASLLLALLVLSGLLYAVQVLADVPLSDRLLFVPAVMLALFVGFAALGWRDQPRGPVRTAWAAAGIALIGLLLATAPGQVDRLDRLDRLVGAQEASIEGLRELSRNPALDRPRGCFPLLAPNHRAGPYLAHFLDIAPAHVEAIGTPTPERGLFVTPATAEAGSVLRDDTGTAPSHTAPPPGFRRSASNASWLLYERGC